MHPELPENEKDFGKDLKTFEKLPAKTKELLILEEQAERATGQESVTLHKKIRDKSEPGDERLKPMHLDPSP